MFKELLHQGDVQGIVIEALPEAAKAVDKSAIVSGSHLHVIIGSYELFKDEKFHYAKIGTDGATLQHIKDTKFDRFDLNIPLPKADHNPVELEKGLIYKFGIHRKLNPFSKTWEKVLD